LSWCEWEEGHETARKVGTHVGRVVEVAVLALEVGVVVAVHDLVARLVALGEVEGVLRGGGDGESGEESENELHGGCLGKRGGD
jgi:hypothetical protein